MIEPKILEDAYREFTERGDAILKAWREPIKLSLSNYKRFGITRKQAEENEGIIIDASLPLPTGTKERLEYLIQYCATYMFERERFQFIERYGAWNETFIEEELRIIAEWMNKATETPLTAAISDNTGKSIEHEFLRLKHGFYEAAILPNDSLQPISKTAAAYGRYFLFREYLAERLQTGNAPPTLAEEALWFMQGTNIKNNAVILSKKDYRRMIEAIDYYLDTREIIKNLQPIRHVNASKAVYVYALRQLHVSRFQAKWAGNFYPLLQQLFADCAPCNTKLETLKRNYTSKPKKGYVEFIEYAQQTALRVSQ